MVPILTVSQALIPNPNPSRRRIFFLSALAPTKLSSSLLHRCPLAAFGFWFPAADHKRRLLLRRLPAGGPIFASPIACRWNWRRRERGTTSSLLAHAAVAAEDASTQRRRCRTTGFHNGRHWSSDSNYASWAVAVELYVEGHDKLDILHGTKVKPDEKDPSFRTWRRDNIQLMTWMLNSVNSGIKQVILHNKTAYDMWKTLEQMYGCRHDMLRTYQISSQIFKLEQGSMSVTNYFATLKGLWDEFDYYRMENWSSTDDHQRYLKLLEKDRIIKFLDGLTAEFKNLKGQILGLDPTPSLEQVYYKILSEEGRKRTMNNKGISAIGPSIGETSVFIGSANKFRPGGTKRQGDRFCRHCKRTNHDSDFCWEKYPEKKPEKFKHNAKKAPNSSNIAVQKIENEESIGSSASSSASTPADSTPFQAHTGATNHMTNAANSIISYSLSSGQEKVIIADGTKATVAGKGSIKLTDHFFLSSALHDLETKQTIGTGREVGGLYYYQLETTSALKSAAKCLETKHQEILLWHSRLGHLNDAPSLGKDDPSLGKDAPSLGAQSSPDIITYKRRRHKQEPTIDRLVESDALAYDPVKQLSSSVESTAPLNMNELNLPVAIRKGVRSCTQHPISNYVSYSRLSPSYHAFVSQLSNHAIPSSYYEARKYVLDLLKETRKLGSRPASTPIKVNHDLTSSSGEDLTSLEKGTYQRLVGKLLYLSMTRPDITYVVSVVSQYMHAPKTIHMKAVDRILRYLKSCPGKGLLFKGGGDLKLLVYDAPVKVSPSYTSILSLFFSACSAHPGTSTRQVAKSDSNVVPIRGTLRCPV
ncbi:hypothetical protein ZIOFF_015211 [Zingiber officinale]|uniref:GAG-pre-integrase domain-containing protein n=1 Tax=Zingiber officinale TaxID=94328 RepID=A0A8J5LM93_ZINOF|nr:hypothetical protein ZIOFF_015211 [Zingiber officinale]